MNKILITGDAGNIGKILKENLEGVIDIDQILKTHTKKDMPVVFNYPYDYELDINNKDNVYKCLKQYKPDTIIHCAAAVGTDKCESDKKIAWESNTSGLYNLIQIANETLKDYTFVNFSTTATMDPDKYDLNNYITKDTPRSPKTWYGKTKMFGEEIVKSFAPRWINFLPVFLFGKYPHDTSSIWAKIFFKSLKKDSFNILLNPEIYKQYEYVENIIPFVKNIITNKEAYNKDIILGGTDRRKFGVFLTIASKIYQDKIGEKLNYNITPSADYLKNHLADSVDMFKYGHISLRYYLDNKVTFECAIRKVLDSVLEGTKYE